MPIDVIQVWDRDIRAANPVIRVPNRTIRAKRHTFFLFCDTLSVVYIAEKGNSYEIIMQQYDFLLAVS